MDICDAQDWIQLHLQPITGGVELTIINISGTLLSNIILAIHSSPSINLTTPNTYTCTLSPSDHLKYVVLYTGTSAGILNAVMSFESKGEIFVQSMQCHLPPQTQEDLLHVRTFDAMLPNLYRLQCPFPAQKSLMEILQCGNNVFHTTFQKFEKSETMWISFSPLVIVRIQFPEIIIYSEKPTHQKSALELVRVLQNTTQDMSSIRDQSHFALGILMEKFLLYLDMNADFISLQEVWQTIVEHLTQLHLPIPAQVNRLIQGKKQSDVMMIEWMEPEKALIHDEFHAMRRGILGSDSKFSALNNYF